MTIPQNFGKSKISLLRGEEAESGRHRKRSALYGDLSFSIEGGPAAALQAPSFNVLYVQTPRIGVLQTPLAQAVMETWQETVELVKPLLRFGFPETSLRTKCPYYDEDLYSTPSGQLLANTHLRKLMTRVDLANTASKQQQQHHQNQHHYQHHQDVLQQQQQQRWQQRELDAAIGHGNLGFLGQTGLSYQPHYRHSQLIRKSQLLVPDLPAGSLVLALNLMAYWMITRQARKGMGM